MNKTKHAIFSAILVLGLSFAVGAQETAIPDSANARLAEVLSRRKVDTSGIQRRGRSDAYQKALSAVPFVISADGSGSSVVVGINSRESTVLVVTNHHVVNHPFVNDKGQPFVLLLFYDPVLVNEPFDRDRVRNCQRSRDATGWCKAFQQSIRPAQILGTDVTKDLALLLVSNSPRDVTQIAAGQIDAVKPGDEVTVVGHPLELLWSLTTGSVSAVRRGFPTGTAQQTARSTVIQTQTPVNPGNSGGPLMNEEGRLIGVVFAQGVSNRIRASSQEGDPRQSNIPIPAAGLNFAIGVNEVQAFVSGLSAKTR
jgi:S1-C subfamily serine protease